MIIPHNKPSLSNSEIIAVTDVLRSSFIAQGNKVVEFENNISGYVNVPYCTVFNSGTTSLYMALYALGIKEGDEIILPTYVCTALLNAIFLHRAIPVLTDVNPEDYNINWGQVETKINVRTKAIIVPHVHGMPGIIPSPVINNIPVIEDCATAISSKLDGKHVGAFGTLSVL